MLYSPLSIAPAGRNVRSSFTRLCGVRARAAARNDVWREAKQTTQGLRTDATRRFVANSNQHDTPMSEESSAERREEVIDEHRLSAATAAVDDDIRELCV